MTWRRCDSCTHASVAHEILVGRCHVDGCECAHFVSPPSEAA